MEYLLILITIGGLGVLIKNPLSAFRVLLSSGYIVLVAVLFGFVADYFFESIGFTIFASMVGMFCSLVSLAILDAMNDNYIKMRFTS